MLGRLWLLVLGAIDLQMRQTRAWQLLASEESLAAHNLQSNMVGDDRGSAVLDASEMMAKKFKSYSGP